MLKSFSTAVGMRAFLARNDGIPSDHVSCMLIVTQLLVEGQYATAAEEVKEAEATYGLLVPDHERNNAGGTVSAEGRWSTEQRDRLWGLLDISGSELWTKRAAAVKRWTTYGGNDGDASVWALFAALGAELRSGEHDTSRFVVSVAQACASVHVMQRTVLKPLYSSSSSTIMPGPVITAVVARSLLEGDVQGAKTVAYASGLLSHSRSRPSHPSTASFSEPGAHAVAICSAV
jgi:hypothetical protein